MGTRADFYVGRGKQAEWIGSIAWDGYPDAIDREVFSAQTEDAYRAAVSAFFADRDDVTLPAEGWPWPWDDSGTTDYAYAFDSGKAWGSCFGGEWFDAQKPEPDHSGESKKAEFPLLKRGQASATPGSKRSGLMVFSVRRG